MIDSGLIEQIVERIIERFRPRRIVLFGSHARGTADTDSDLDLFVEMETSRRPPERSIEVSAIFGLRSWPMDIVVYTPEEVRSLRGVKGTLLSIIEAEGKVLYAEPDEVEGRAMVAGAYRVRSEIMARLPYDSPDQLLL